MTSAFAAGQILGPLLVSLLAQRADGFSTALWIGFAALVSSVLLLRGTPAAASG
jgi:hypothetical protein